MSLRTVVIGAFDDLRSKETRFLEAASQLGELTVLLWSDELCVRFLGQAPRFPEAERLYLIRALRYPQQVILVKYLASPFELPEEFLPADWVVSEAEDHPERRKFCLTRKMSYQVLPPPDPIAGSSPAPILSSTAAKKVLVTGCYDWLHSGHVRFFEEASAWGDLYVVVGHDANIRLLKGPGHPLLSQEERRYAVGAIRFVKQALISTGQGWLDAEPEIARLVPDFYIVNEEGDQGGKREFCQQRGIQYVVLKRRPAPGLPSRTSTHLRGF